MTIDIENFLAPIINTQFLPRPDAIATLDSEALIAERMALFQQLATLAGFPYDVGALETDPIKIAQEVGALREVLMRARVNSAVRAVLPAYAQGADLENIVARANIARLQTGVDPETQVPIMETDTQLLVRYLTGFAAPAAGSEDGIIFRALTAVPGLRDIVCNGPAVHGKPGEVRIRLLEDGGAPTTIGTINKVREALEDRGAMPLTDVWDVASATIIEYEIEARITIPPGPIPAEIIDAVETAITAAAIARYRIGAEVYLNVLGGAGYIANVRRVEILSPAADIICNPYQAAYPTSVIVTAVTE